MTDSHKPEQELVANLEERLRRFGEPERAETRSAWERHDGRFRHSVGIIMLDLDNFKRFNDTYGHQGGDALLRELGSMLQRSILGGEGFTLILPEVTIADAGQRAEHVREAIKNIRAQHRRQPLGPVTVSLGVATCPENGPSGEAVLGAADTALYQAKAWGRDQVGLNRSGFYHSATLPPPRAGSN